MIILLKMLNKKINKGYNVSNYKKMLLFSIFWLLIPLSGYTTSEVYYFSLDMQKFIFTQKIIFLQNFNNSCNRHLNYKNIL